MNQPTEHMSIESENLIAVSVLDSSTTDYRIHHHAPVMGADDHANSGLSLDKSAKTLAFLVAGERLALVALPATSKLGYGQLARILSASRSQIKPAPPEALERLGMKPGGVCPFTDDAGVQVVIDEQVFTFPVIYCGSGDPGFTVEITAEQLRRACPAAVIADVKAVQANA
ncbi:aminoacyl-tRNA deacylase [Paenarthrobacter sp. NPDC056912]|uniref:aminoacyl-tRNA deacylase n=1 Tax=Paenarthrobacter sp. NPDC056912 TaxID=3345965 RepID=UPI00366BD735